MTKHSLEKYHHFNFTKIKSNYWYDFFCSQEAEKAAQAKQDRADARAAAAEEAKEAAANAVLAAENANIVHSPSNFSCHSYELFVGQPKGHDDNNKEKMSIRSEGLDSVSERRRIPNNLTKMRKVSAVSVLIFIEPLGNEISSRQVTFSKLSNIFTEKLYFSKSVESKIFKSSNSL